MVNWERESLLRHNVCVSVCVCAFELLGKFSISVFRYFSIWWFGSGSWAVVVTSDVSAGV